jgi:DNA-binding beta-propeller fold protein YncE
MRVLRWLLLFPFLVNGLSAGGVTWTDRGASAIKRMNFDGTALVTVSVSGAVVSPGTNIRGIALDVSGGRMFWADNGGDRILRANLDGTSATILASLPAGISFPADVRLDLTGERIYFCDQQRNLLQRMTFSGAGLETVINTANGNQPYFLDVVLAAGKVYWGGFTSGNLYRANLDGSAIETIVTGNNNVRGVCVDSAGGMIYWINRDDKKVHRCLLSALPVNVLTSPAVQTLYQGLDTPHGLVLDLPARKLYWADTGSNVGIGLGDKAVSRGDLDGATPLEVLAAGSEPWDVDVDPRCATYGEWRARYFRKDAPVSVTASVADPDGDGQINALEYACGSHPLHAGAPASPVVGFIYHDGVTGFPHLAVRFHRRPASTDLVYFVQVSEDLVAWRDSRNAGLLPTTVEVGTEAAADHLEVVTTRTEAPFDSARPAFLRLQVSLTP